MSFLVFLDSWSASLEDPRRSVGNKYKRCEQYCGALIRKFWKELIDVTEIADGYQILSVSLTAIDDAEIEGPAAVSKEAEYSWR